MSFNDYSKKQFALGLPNYRFSITSSLYQLLRQLNLDAYQELFCTCSDIVNARNAIVGQFLNTPELSQANVLVFIDQDTEADRNMIAKLVMMCNEEKPVAGTNMTYRGSDLPNWFLKDDKDFEKRKEVIRRANPYNNFVEVENMGFGLVALHRSLIVEMADNYGFYDFGGIIAPNLFGRLIQPVADKEEAPPHLLGEMLPETYSFCKRVRELGKPLLVYLGITPGHIQEIAKYAS